MGQPEGNNENTATQLAQAFGYTTDIGEPLTENNDSPLAGDEVRSNFWERSNLSEPIVVRQIAAFHGCCTSGDRFEFKSTTGSNLGGFNHDPLYGQTILPLKASGQGGGKAELVWNNANQPFQITAANYSSNTTGNLGIRTWPVIDRDGEVVRDAWYVIQDFVQGGCGSGSANCDYNDNVYLITNIVPQGERDTEPPAAPAGLSATLQVDGDVILTWDANTEDDLAGYDVERATSTAGPWTKLNASLLTTTTFVDTNPPSALNVYYRVVAVDQVSNRSTPSELASVSTSDDPDGPEPGYGEIIRFNAGGPAVTTSGIDWAEDQFFVGGKSYTNPNVTSIAGTDDDVLYLTERSATANLEPFDYEIPVANGTYEVRLHLAEIWFGAPNSGPAGAGNRVFSVTAEGEPFLTDYDIFAEVGTTTAVIETATVEVTDGVLDLAFTATVNQPKVSAIEVLEILDGEVPAATDTVRINTGGPEQSVDGTVWSACSSLTNCNGWVSGGFAYTEMQTIADVPANTNQTIFHSEWTGGAAGPAGTIVPVGERAFGFDIPVTDGSYVVRLHFAELNKYEPGARIFDVVLEGQTVLDGLDLFAQVGVHTATVFEFPVVVTDGVVTIDFIHQVENAKISAIEILPSTGPGTPEPEPEDPAGPDPDPGTASATMSITATGEINASGYGSGTFVLVNTGDQVIESFRLDLTDAVFEDMVFDPAGTAGDIVARDFTVDSTDGGQIAVSSHTFSAGTADDGYRILDVDFDAFPAGTTLTFSVDLDPATIKGTEAPGPNDSGSVSGLEMIGGEVVLGFEDGLERSGILFAIDGSPAGSRAFVADDPPQAPTLAVTGLSSPATTDVTTPTVTVTGPAGATVRLVVMEGGLFLPTQDDIVVDGVIAPDPSELDAYLVNSLVAVRHHEAVIGAGGSVDIEVVLSDMGNGAGINTIVGAIVGEGGVTGAISDPFVLKIG
jgi:hypothetical protein